MLTISWLYLYVKGPVSGLGKWSINDETYNVWFTVVSNDYLREEQTTEEVDSVFVSKEELKKLSKEQRFLQLADNFAAEQAKRAKHKKPTNRQYYLYLLTNEQVEDLNNIYYKYCADCNIKPGYIRDNALDPEEEKFCNKQNLVELAQQSEDNTVELAFKGLTKSSSAKFNIVLPELDIWKTISQQNITNFYPQ